MAWWELRIRVDANEYEDFADALSKKMRPVVGESADVGLEARREEREAVISSLEKHLLEALVLWALQLYPSTQINLTLRCYRTTDRPEAAPGSPWQRCQCPPDSHIGQTPYPPRTLHFTKRKP